jgi:hypothetical protein
MGTRSNNSELCRTVSSILWLAAAAIFHFEMSHTTAIAQIHGVAVKVTRAAPGALLHNGGVPSALKQGDTLQPGDVIDTGANGSVVIALSDGSQVIIFPKSRVELRDFKSGGSWRELLKVTVGRVRATINHQGKRPNPYRVYSPVASIAVRGTDFLVIVEPGGETRVLVYEGLVEVGSLVNPQKSVLVRPGRNIIVRPDGDISMVTAAPRGELNEIKSLRIGNSLDNNLNAAYQSHQKNFTDMRPSRFTAFNDSHIDSLQNPAYATEFRRPEGRFYLIPSFSPEIVTSYTYDINTFESEPGAISSTNYTASSQLSFFAPIGARMVVGGGVAVTKTDLGGTETDRPYTTQQIQRRLAEHFRGPVVAMDLSGVVDVSKCPPGVSCAVVPPDPPAGRHLPEGGVFTLRSAGKAKFTTTNMALMIARRFGRMERTSVGVKFDYLEDQSSYSLDKNWSTKSDFTQEKGVSSNRRMGFTMGLTHNFGDDKKLGVYYSRSSGLVPRQFQRTEYYEFIELKTFFTRYGQTRFSDSEPRRLSEVGARFRGSVTRRLFYGVEGSFLDERRQREVPTLFTPSTHEVIGTEIHHTRIRSAMLGAGIGYALRRRTVLGMDISAGREFADYWSEHRYPPGIEGSVNDDNDRHAFWSTHFGGQTDLWRNLYIGGSVLYLKEGSKYQHRSVFRGETHFSFQNSLEEKSRSSSLSLGWRMSPDWIVQYTYFKNRIDYSGYAPSHTLLFRYEFGRQEEK